MSSVCFNKPVLFLLQPDSAGLQQQHGQSFSLSILPPSVAFEHEHHCRGQVENSHLYPCLKIQTFNNYQKPDSSHLSLVNFLYEGYIILSGVSGQSYQVQTTPDLVKARENWAPHSIWQTLCPLSLSMFWGMLQPSLPPRPSFPKSPSPQENTNPGKI